ncbi:class I SAM-dependent methyltransferase [Pontibacter silvestris]|uniref:Class I SAM-dependent methyltransferase n=1 Tax=Pontibacter silvestris TaxID=2305183 RepID=A0ABW4WY58_9BACT|nr:class I SAM-dependent methyltransferase [Pontibacter silvestris]MCC9135224.1 class I SAM-dependent methyltransferase [Pontibacter silvestris]
MIPSLSELSSLFANIDIYLFDQLLKGRINAGMRLLDAGCGNGRNIKYLIQAGLDVFGADVSEVAIQELQELAARIAPHLPQENFTVSDLRSLPYPDACFDVVLCSAVLHFAKSENHFREMVTELWRVLKPDGMLFCRFSTTIGLEGKLHHLQDRFYQMPHGKTWFLADKKILQEVEHQLKAERLEPLKTVLVEEERTMTTWVLRK